MGSLDHPRQGVPNVRTVAVMNEKVGSGKTTTTISLAAVLAERGLRHVVVDLDLKPRPAYRWGEEGNPVSTARSRKSATSRLCWATSLTRRCRQNACTLT